jgi:hypothetical protein
MQHMHEMIAGDNDMVADGPAIVDVILSRVAS